MSTNPKSTKAPSTPADAARRVAPNFITEVIDRDLASGRIDQVVTRFPPEPNGYLHIGHAKAIFVDFGLARDYRGRVHLRMDDTNPTTEDPRYVASIERDVRWLGFEWDAFHHASDYFEELYALALRLIDRGDAYVDLRDEATIRATRGSVTEPGTPSADRERPAGENRALFERMRAGAFGEGEAVLRAKIDLANPNMILRDPVLYRIKHATHYRSGDAWCLYPLYDFAHPLSDAIEGITHSLCTLEFDNNRAIYDWLVERLFKEPRPRQYEFARLVLDRTVLSKRKLIALVQGGVVDGWDDPRMPTLAGLRRRGIPPEALLDFVDRVGVTKTNSRTDPALLAASVRHQLNPSAPRALAVLEPVELQLEDPSGLLGEGLLLAAPSFPEDVLAQRPELAGVARALPLGRRLWIEREDVHADPPAGFKRLAPGRVVRLRHGPLIRCLEVSLASDGAVAAVRAEVLADSLGQTPAGVKVWAAIHWVDAAAGVAAEFELIEDLFTVDDPDAAEDFLAVLNPTSRRRLQGFVEPAVLSAAPDQRFQFERQGYFWRDPGSDEGAGGEVLRFLRIAPLKDRRPEAAAAGTPAAVGAAAPAAAAAATEASGAEGPEVHFAHLDDAARAAAEGYLQLGIDAGHAAVIAGDATLSALLAGALNAGAEAASAASWVAQETRRALREQAQISPLADGAALAQLLAMLASGAVTAGSAREAWGAVLAGEGTPEQVVAERGLAALVDPGALSAQAQALIAAHPEEVAAYRAGKRGLIGFFIGAAMRSSGGRADPQRLRQAIEQALEG